MDIHKISVNELERDEVGFNVGKPNEIVCNKTPIIYVYDSKKISAKCYV